MGGCVPKCTTPELLSIEQLLRVRARLESRKRLTEELKACFNLALSEFSQEPLCIQENARMTIQSGTTVLVFATGKQENEISIFYLNEEVQYNIKITRWDASAARVCSRVIVKSVAEMVSYIPAEWLLETLKNMVQLGLKSKFVPLGWLF
ncbi:hypothetical protein KIL84_004609 [Mauremys mutica]|uniref:Uncharacterized protein n=1 Tax=Mauremys mutica TaxID=74926 RepID=A0A9D4B065_9SAUR|nr:hypothetical protein KIL84_004609 [Mauremys mutica]